MEDYQRVAAVLVEGQMNKRLPRDQAFQRTRTAAYKAIVDFEEQIERIVERFGNTVPAEWQQTIGSLQAGIGREKNLLKALDDLEESSWARG
jgi:hypothetical protein